MTLAARCPSCKTAFKIPDTLLQKQNGLVRCANCSHVFNAYEHAIELSKVIKTVRKPKPNSSNTFVNTANTFEKPFGLSESNESNESNDVNVTNDSQKKQSQSKLAPQANNQYLDESNELQAPTRQSKLDKIQQGFNLNKNPLTEAINLDQKSDETSQYGQKRFNEGADELKKALSQLNQSKAYQDIVTADLDDSDASNTPSQAADDSESINQGLIKPAAANNLAEPPANSDLGRSLQMNQNKALDLNATEKLSLVDGQSDLMQSGLQNHDLFAQNDLDVQLKGKSKNNPFATKSAAIDQKFSQMGQNVETLGESIAQKVSTLVHSVEGLFKRRPKESTTQKNLDVVLDSWQKEQKKRNRNLLLLSGFFLLLLLGTIFWQRNQIIANVPATFPFFTKVCQQFKCQISPLEMDNNPIISYSDMQKDMSLASNRYIMNIGLKNKENLPAAMPFLEISLFDLNEQIIARRIFHPQEFLRVEDWQRVEKSGMTAEEELPIKIRFQIQQAVSSFKVTAFYQ
jgi:predicted Zn finger-like uncharacterized protein